MTHRRESEFGSDETLASADGPSSVELPAPLRLCPPQRVALHRVKRRGLRDRARPQQSSDSAHARTVGLVEEVWSRTAEWGPTFLVSGPHG